MIEYKENKIVVYKSTTIQRRRFIKMAENVIKCMESCNIIINDNMLKDINNILQSVENYKTSGARIYSFYAAMTIYILRYKKIPCNNKLIFKYFNITRVRTTTFNILDYLYENFNLLELQKLTIKDHLKYCINKLCIMKLIPKKHKITLLDLGILYVDILVKNNHNKPNSTYTSAILEIILKLSDFNINQPIIAKIAGVSEVTMREAIKDIKKIKNIDSIKPVVYNKIKTIKKLPVNYIVNYKKDQIWTEPKNKIMLEFEEETGKNPVYRGRITGQFEYWQWQQEKIKHRKLK